MDFVILFINSANVYNVVIKFFTDERSSSPIDLDRDIINKQTSVIYKFVSCFKASVVLIQKLLTILVNIVLLFPTIPM